MLMHWPRGREKSPVQQCVQAGLAAAKPTTAGGPSVLGVKAGGGGGMLLLFLLGVK